MSESEYWRKHDLECLRLAADCKRLASEASNSALRFHFLRMAEEWTSLTDRGADTWTSH